MDTVVVQLPFMHETSYVPPGGRTATTRMARARGDFRVPSGTAAELRVSALLVREGKPPVPTFLHEGRAYNAVDVDERLGVDDFNDDGLGLPPPRLVGLERVAPIPRRFADADTEEGIHADAVRFSRRDGAVRRVGDERDLRYGEAAKAYAEFVLLVDGEALTNGRGAEPCWEVRLEDDAVRVDARMDPAFDAGAAYFSADREAEAMAMARTIAADAGLPVRRSRDAIRVVDADALRFDEAKAIARSLAQAYAKAIAALPGALGLYRGVRRRFPDLHDRPRHWPPSLHQAALDLRGLSDVRPHAMDARWTADVLRAYGALARGADRSGAQVRAFVGQAIGTGRACHARWATIRERHPEVDAMVAEDETPREDEPEVDEDREAVLGMR